MNKRNEIEQILGKDLTDIVYSNLGTRHISDLTFENVKQIIDVFKENNLSNEMIDICINF